PPCSRPPASYAHCWAGTRRALLPGGLGVRQGGLVLIRPPPLGNNNQFHEITLHSKASGLPWREHAFVRHGLGTRDTESLQVRPRFFRCMPGRLAKLALVLTYASQYQVSHPKICEAVGSRRIVDKSS